MSLKKSKIPKAIKVSIKQPIKAGIVFLKKIIGSLLANLINVLVYDLYPFYISIGNFLSA